MQTLKSCSHQLGQPAQRARIFFLSSSKNIQKEKLYTNLLYKRTVLKTYVQKLSVKIFYNHIIFIRVMTVQGEQSACSAEDPADTRHACSIHGLGRVPGGGNGNPLQYSCLENSMDRAAWQTTAHGITKSRTQLSICTHTHTHTHTHTLYINIFRGEKNLLRVKFVHIYEIHICENEFSS